MGETIVKMHLEKHTRRMEKFDGDAGSLYISKLVFGDKGAPSEIEIVLKWKD